MADLDGAIHSAITKPEYLWTPGEILESPQIVPAEAGVYGWYFRALPGKFDVTNCIRRGDMTLLYVGIAPGRLGSRSHLRKRLMQHCKDRGASTLRRTLAALLAEPLGLVPGSGLRGRLRIGDEGERRLSSWLAENAAVTWAVTPEPWLAERAFLAELDLPLNLMHNAAHPFAVELSAARAAARRMILAAELTDVARRTEAVSGSSRREGDAADFRGSERLK